MLRKLIATQLQKAQMQYDGESHYLSVRIATLQEVLDIATVVYAREHLDTKEGQDDPSLSTYMVRDLRLVAKLGFSDLLWAVHKAGYVSLNEAKGILDDLLKAIQEM